ncbi:hypothetical protein Pmani_018798 [Petrolisthes manimaculis]|uniref:Uncharacterized protein n=1 Tax=Petrolisthes manimaculis TaxID=1843537 RepID=A0AAE1U807_9EUCA|nr:hypothetical protein Pmani_018798 [Petrolisthes manimaculis]
MVVWREETTNQQPTNVPPLCLCPLTLVSPSPSTPPLSTCAHNWFITGKVATSEGWLAGWKGEMEWGSSGTRHTPPLLYFP